MENEYTDSHTHLYLDAFESDRDLMIRRAVSKRVTRMFLPNIDSQTMNGLFRLADQYRGTCFPMSGLHPTSVKQNYREELVKVYRGFERDDVIAVGETGIDLYWDKTYAEEQEEAFRIQIGWALELQLPVVIHARDSFREIFSVLDQYRGKGLTGVFHSFTGGPETLEKALSYEGFMLGINGIVTFKNSNLDGVARSIPLDRLLLETDAPFLAPAPHRGHRNESSYLVEIAGRVAQIHGLSVEEVAGITSRNASQLFQIT